MTLTEWFKINPNHKCALSPDGIGGVQANLHGGDGIDRQIVGRGPDEVSSIAHALEVRDEIAKKLAG